MINAGTASNIVNADPNMSTTDTPPVTITFDASGTVPAGYSDTGESFGGEPGSQFNGLTTECTQDAAPEVSSSIYNRSYSSSCGRYWRLLLMELILQMMLLVIVPTGVTSYFLNSPSGEGGTISGPGGIMSISRNSSVTYTWTIL